MSGQHEQKLNRSSNLPAAGSSGILIFFFYWAGNLMNLKAHWALEWSVRFTTCWGTTWRITRWGSSLQCEYLADGVDMRKGWWRKANCFIWTICKCTQLNEEFLYSSGNDVHGFAKTDHRAWSFPRVEHKEVEECQQAPRVIPSATCGQPCPYMTSSSAPV